MGKSKKTFTIYNIITTAIEEAVLLLVLLVFLPGIGVNVPGFIVAVLAMAWVAWSYLTYRLGARAIGKTPVLGKEAMVGTKCRTTTKLSPAGYVQAGNERWQAYSPDGEIQAGVEVVVTAVDGLTLYVRPLSVVTGDKLVPK